MKSHSPKYIQKQDLNIVPFVKSRIFQIYFANVPKSRDKIGEIEWGQKDHKGEYNMEHDKERKGKERKHGDKRGTKGSQRGV